MASPSPSVSPLQSPSSSQRQLSPAASKLSDDKLRSLSHTRVLKRAGSNHVYSDVMDAVMSKDRNQKVEHLVQKSVADVSERLKSVEGEVAQMRARQVDMNAGESWAPPEDNARLLDFVKGLEERVESQLTATRSLIEEINRNYLQLEKSIQEDKMQQAAAVVQIRETWDNSFESLRRDVQFLTQGAEMKLGERCELHNSDMAELRGRCREVIASLEQKSDEDNQTLRAEFQSEVEALRHALKGIAGSASSVASGSSIGLPGSGTSAAFDIIAGRCEEVATELAVERDNRCIGIAELRSDILEEVAAAEKRTEDLVASLRQSLQEEASPVREASQKGFHAAGELRSEFLGAVESAENRFTSALDGLSIRCDKLDTDIQHGQHEQEVNFGWLADDVSSRIEAFGKAEKTERDNMVDHFRAIVHQEMERMESTIEQISSKCAQALASGRCDSNAFEEIRLMQLNMQQDLGFVNGKVAEVATRQENAAAFSINTELLTAMDTIADLVEKCQQISYELNSDREAFSRLSKAQDDVLRRVRDLEVQPRRQPSKTLPDTALSSESLAAREVEVDARPRHRSRDPSSARAEAGSDALPPAAETSSSTFGPLEEELNAVKAKYTQLAIDFQVEQEVRSVGFAVIHQEVTEKLQDVVARQMQPLLSRRCEDAEGAMERRFVDLRRALEQHIDEQAQTSLPALSQQIEQGQKDSAELVKAAEARMGAALERLSAKCQQVSEAFQNDKDVRLAAPAVTNTDLSRHLRESEARIEERFTLHRDLVLQDVKGVRMLATSHIQDANQRYATLADGHQRLRSELSESSQSVSQKQEVVEEMHAATKAQLYEAIHAVETRMVKHLEGEVAEVRREREVQMDNIKSVNLKHGSHGDKLAETERSLQDMFQTIEKQGQAIKSLEAKLGSLLGGEVAEQAQAGQSMEQRLMKFLEGEVAEVRREHEVQLDHMNQVDRMQGSHAEKIAQAEHVLQGLQQQLQVAQDDVAANRGSVRENTTLCKDMMMQLRNHEARFRQEVDSLGDRMAEELGASIRGLNQKLAIEQGFRSAAVAELRSEISKRCGYHSGNGVSTSREFSAKRATDDSLGEHSTWTSRSFSSGPCPERDRGARAAANHELREELEKQLRDISAGRHVPILERLHRTDYSPGSAGERGSSLDNNSPKSSKKFLQAMEARMGIGRSREMLKQNLQAAAESGSEWLSTTR